MSLSGVTTDTCIGTHRARCAGGTEESRRGPIKQGMMRDHGGEPKKGLVQFESACSLDIRSAPNFSSSNGWTWATTSAPNATSSSSVRFTTVTP